MSALHLVRYDAQPFLDHPAHELSGKEAVFAAQQEFRRYVRPASQRPWLDEWSAGLATFAPSYGLSRHLLRDIMKEDGERVDVTVDWQPQPRITLAPCFNVPGIVPPFSRRLMRTRNLG